MNLKLVSNLLVSFTLLTMSVLTNNAQAQNPVQAPPKYRVAISDLIVSPNVSSKQAEIVKKSSLITDIENAFRNTRKFEVLTRRASHMEALIKEQEFAKSEYAAGDAAQTGKMKSAQSLINVEVLSFAFGRSATAVPNLEGKWHVSDYCSIELSVQIIDTQTGTINAAFPVKTSSGSGKYMSNSRYGSSTTILNKTLEKASVILTNEFSNTVFPALVIKVEGKQIWVNRGDDSAMKFGEIFEIFQPGEDLIDPSTGENLGSAEMSIGRAKVTRINPKFTVMEITKGDPTQIHPSFILRKPTKI